MMKRPQWGRDNPTVASLVLLLGETFVQLPADTSGQDDASNGHCGGNCRGEFSRHGGSYSREIKDRRGECGDGGYDAEGRTGYDFANVAFDEQSSFFTHVDGLLFDLECSRPSREVVTPLGAVPF